MANPTVDIDSQLRALRDEYAIQLPAKIAQITDAWNVLQQGAWDVEAFVSLHRSVHSLVGSSGTYGFLEPSRRAHAAEVYLKSVLDCASLPSGAQRREIGILLSALKAVGEPAEREPRPLESRACSVSPPPPQPGNRLVFLAESDTRLAGDLASQIGCFGYIVQVFDRLAALKRAAGQMAPAVIVVDTLFLELEPAVFEMLTDNGTSPSAPMPLVFVSDRDDLAARLAAVRAGAQGYFLKPIEMGHLISRLDLLTCPQEPEPLRVLIVDDAPEMAAFLCKHLEQAGIVVAAVSDPLQVMQPLAEFNPDLILMDVYMPGCTGMELAAVIRQQENYVGIPIVYLSAEKNTDRQIEALRLGGDDLTKPIEPQHVISSVIARSQRSRILRSFMARDGLTGLLNHTATKERLDIEVARASRQNKSLAFAMLDLDLFKSVNDSHGHAAGDRVLRSLSQLMTQRLRKTDAIGRYGGEEFAAILTDTTDQNAARILDEIHNGFAQLRHPSANGEFSVTVSCGVATYPHCPDASSLTTAADKALYEAKRQGRDRVILAE